MRAIKPTKILDIWTQGHFDFIFKKLIISREVYIKDIMVIEAILPTKSHNHYLYFYENKILEKQVGKKLDDTALKFFTIKDFRSLSYVAEELVYNLPEVSELIIQETTELYNAEKIFIKTLGLVPESREYSINHTDFNHERRRFNFQKNIKLWFRNKEQKFSFTISEFSSEKSYSCRYGTPTKEINVTTSLVNSVNLNNIIIQTYSTYKPEYLERDFTKGLDKIYQNKLIIRELYENPEVADCVVATKESYIKDFNLTILQFGKGLSKVSFPDNSIETMALLDKKEKELNKLKKDYELLELYVHYMDKVFVEHPHLKILVINNLDKAKAILLKEEENFMLLSNHYLSISQKYIGAKLDSIFQNLTNVK